MAEKYTALITRVITDFDNIFNALARKGVVYKDKIDGKDVVLGTGTATVNGGLIPTAEYHTYISSQLFKIENLAATDSIISNYSGAQKAGTTTTLGAHTAGDTVGVSKVPVTIVGIDPGYYDSTSQIKGTINALDYTFSTSGLTAQDGVYYYKPTDNGVMSSVTVAKGKVEIGFADGSVTNGLVITPSVGFTSDDVDIVKSVNSGDTDHYEIKYKVTNTKSGSFKFTPSKTQFTEGYVTSADVTFKGNKENSSEYEYSFTGAETETEDQTFYIPKGKLVVKSSNTSNATASVSGDAVNWAADNEDGVVVSASVGKISLEGEITEGYVIPDATNSAVQIPEITVGSGSRKIKKATPENFVFTDETEKSGNYVGATSTASNMLATSGTSDDYKITVSASASETKTIAADKHGYLAAGTTYSATLESTKEYFIKKAAATVTATSEISGKALGIATDSKVANDDFAIELKSTITLGKTLTQAGYLSATTEITEGTKTEGTKTVYVARGKMTASNGIAATLTERAGDGAGEATDSTTNTAIDIFLDEAPDTGDYYEIKATAGITPTKCGYIQDANDLDTTNAIVSKFLPKALVQWVERGDGEEDYLEVTRGGYLPSGNITKITTAAMGNASLTVVADEDSSSIFKTGTKTGAYALNLTKGVVNAGYMSQKSGDVTGNFYVEKATLNVVSTENEALTAGAATYDNAKSKYIVSVSGSIKTTLALDQAGYITEDDLTLNGAKYDKTKDNIQELSTSVELDKAVLGVAATGNSITLGVDNGSIELGSDASDGYLIKPTLTTGTIKVEPTTAGYLAETDSSELTINAATAGTQTGVYIKKGTGAALGLSSTSNLAIDASELSDSSITGDYKLRISGSVGVDGTLGSGYYAATDSEKKTLAIAAQTLTLTDAQKTATEITITRGSVTSVVSATAKVTTAEDETGVAFAQSTDSSKEYVSFTAEIGSLTNTLTTKAGYIKESDATKATTNSATSPSVTKYIEAINTKGTDNIIKVDTVETVKYYKVTVGATEEVELANANNAAYQGVELDTDQKYSKYDTKIVLGAHAMGTAVVSELSDLEARLDGIYTRITG